MRISLITRRSFLRYCAVTSGLMALGNLRLAPGTREALAGSSYPWHVLGEREAAILEAVIERMMRGDDPHLPPVRQTQAVETVDWALTHVAEEQQVQFRWLLRLFQWSPPFMIRRFSPFTSLASSEQDRCLLAWERSSVGWITLGFRALKTVSALGYYSQQATWPIIGYRGPWVARPARSPRSVEVR